MSQATTWSVPLVAPASPTLMATRMDDSLGALLSGHKGGSRPAYAVAGTTWIDDTSTPWVVNVWTGSVDIPIGEINATTEEFFPYTGAGLVVTEGRMIGEPFVLFDNITGVSEPDNSGTRKFIKLTAGLTGAGAYNEGLLENESVTGTAPLVEATAEIATGPLAGETVHLMNSEGSFLRAGTTAGTLQNDQTQGHKHTIIGRQTGSASVWAPSVITTNGDLKVVDAPGENMSPTLITDGTNGTPRTGTETRAKNVSATFYMRIV